MSETEDWLYRYSEVLQWSERERVQALIDYVQETDQADKFVSYLRYRTGVELLPEDGDDYSFRGKPFVVLAFGPQAEHYELERVERIDTDTEVEALVAFTKLVESGDFNSVHLERFSNDGKARLEILGYQDALNGPRLTTRKLDDYDYPDSFSDGQRASAT